MLHIKNLSVKIHDREIIKKLSLEIQPGSFHALMGPNGCGKSSLSYTIMGHPSYIIMQGTLQFNGQDLSLLSPDKRAKLGIFLAFQHPYEIPGLSVFNFLKEAYQARYQKIIEVAEFNSLLQAAFEKLAINPAFAQRGVNEGFSGGEKKKLELLQMLILQPTLAIIDEIDSGLDVDALKIVAQGILAIREHNPAMSILMITHYPRIFSYMTPEHVHIMRDGAIVSSGDGQLADAIGENGYDGALKSEHCQAEL